MIIGKTKDGHEVSERTKSHVHAGAKKHLREALAEINTEDASFIKKEVIFGKNIGLTYCVKTNSKDTTYLKRRANRRGPSRFVLNREPEPCKSMVVILKKIKMGYLLVTAFVGKMAEPEPWDTRAFKADARGFEAARHASIQFWKHNALIQE